MYTLYDEQNGKRLFISTFEDEFTAEVTADHIRCDHPNWNVVIVNEANG